MINKVFLIGNLGKDPEIRHLEGNRQVASFSLATHENYQDREGNWQTQTEWHNIVLWGPLATRAEARLKKGLQIFVEGKIRTRKWTDTDGKDRYTTDIVADTFRILGKKEDDGTTRTEYGSSSGSEQYKPDNFPDANTEGSPKDIENDLPF